MATRSQEQISDIAELVEARSTALLRLAYAVVGDHQLAQDLLQEALVKVYVAWPRLRDVSAAEAYARRTIVTTAISWRRRHSFHERPLDVQPDQAGNEADQSDRLVTHDVLWQQVRSLPPRQRAALVLRYYEDLSEADTASLMGCSTGTVKSQLSAALGKLRERIGPDSGLLFTDDQAVTR
jgi:RNA polymerase sigma-70 factor (sigma-E family)